MKGLINAGRTSQERSNDTDLSNANKTWPKIHRQLAQPVEEATGSTQNQGPERERGGEGERELELDKFNTQV